MKSHNRLWMLTAGTMILIAGHGFTLYYISSHLALSSAVIAGVVALVVVKHLGLIGPLLRDTAGGRATLVTKDAPACLIEGTK